MHCNAICTDCYKTFPTQGYIKVVKMVTLSGTRSTDLTALQYPRTGLTSLWAYSMERNLLMMEDVIKAELLQLPARRIGGRAP